MVGGIAGRFNRSEKPVQIGEIEHMLSLLGPEVAIRSGINAEKFVTLGQMSLGIKMDWDEAHGPLMDSERQLYIAANACVLNRDELLSKFSITGHECSVISDSKLILMSYERWGTSCPEKLVGDFAFVIWDSRRKRLFCARDQTGLYSFCYNITNETFIFATEVKSILAAAGVNIDLNPYDLADFVLDLKHNAESTPFSGIKILPPAHAMLVEGHRHFCWQYWNIINSPDISYPRRQDYVEAMEELLAKVITSHLTSSEKIGLQTGGGLKSAAIAAIVAPALRKRNKRIFAVSYVLHDDYSGICRDERTYTDELALDLDIDMHYVTENRFPPPFDEDIERKFYLQDSPRVNPFGSDHYVVYGAMKHHGIKIMLTPGASIFPVRKSPILAETALRGQWLKLFNYMTTKRGCTGEGSLMSLFKELFLPLMPDGLYYRLLQLRTMNDIYSKRASIFNDDLVVRLGLYDKIRQHYNDLPGQKRVRPTLRDNLIQGFNSNSNLGKKYISAQERRYGFSIRRPLFDKRLIEFVIGTCASRDITEDSPRDWLKLLLKGKVPESIRSRTGRCSYPADLLDRYITADKNIIKALSEITKDDEVWEYINRKRINELIVEYGPRLCFPHTWRAYQPNILIHVILLQRFLGWVHKFYNTQKANCRKNL